MSETHRAPGTVRFPNPRALKKAAKTAKTSRLLTERQAAMSVLATASNANPTDAQRQARAVNGANGGRPRSEGRVVCDTCKADDRRTVRRVVIETQQPEAGGRVFVNGYRALCRECGQAAGVNWSAGDLLYSAKGIVPGTNREGGAS